MRRVSYKSRWIGRIRDGSGYSLMEVLAAIMLLSIAILPMVGMFDAGLRAATTGSNYDKARSLANKQLELAKSLPYDRVRDKFPDKLASADPLDKTTYNASGEYKASNQVDPDPAYAAFRYEVTKQFVAFNPTADASKMELKNASNNDARMIRITVTVSWGAGNSYSTTGMVAE